jgi:hypothetical protein
MHFDNPVNLVSSKIDKSIQKLRDGLEPEVLAYWYKQIEYQANEKVEQELKGKIHFEQDRILWMKFKINISIRAIPIVLEIIENNISLMEYSTGLYFRKIQEILLKQLDNSNIIDIENKKINKKNSKSKKRKTFYIKKRKFKAKD